MQTFLENSHPAVQSLESLQQSALEEFSRTASYFGEDGKSTNTEAFFGIFAEFINKFEVRRKDFKCGCFFFVVWGRGEGVKSSLPANRETFQTLIVL